jgi:hypothetical protein
MNYIKKFLLGIALLVVTGICWLGMELIHILAIVTKRQDLDTQYKILRYKFHRS